MQQHGSQTLASMDDQTTPDIAVALSLYISALLNDKQPLQQLNIAMSCIVVVYACDTPCCVDP